MASKSLEWSSQYALICILVFCCFRCALSDNNKVSYVDPHSVKVTDTSKKLEDLWNPRYEDGYLVVDSWEGDVYEMICPNGVPDPDRGTPFISVFLILDGLFPHGQSPSRGQIAYFMHEYYKKKLDGEHNCMAIVYPDYSKYVFAGVMEIVSQIMPDITILLEHIGKARTRYRLFVWSCGYGTVVTRALFSDMLSDLYKQTNDIDVKTTKFKNTITDLYKSGLYFLCVAGPARMLPITLDLNKVPEVLSLKESYGTDDRQVMWRLASAENEGKSFLSESNVLLVGVLGDTIVDWRTALDMEPTLQDPAGLQLFGMKEFDEEKKVLVNLAHTARRSKFFGRARNAEHFFSLETSSHTVATLNGKFTADGVRAVNKYISKLFQIVSGGSFSSEPRYDDHGDMAGSGSASGYVHDLTIEAFTQYTELYDDGDNVVGVKEEAYSRDENFYGRDPRTPPPEMGEKVRSEMEDWFEEEEERDSF